MRRRSFLALAGAAAAFPRVALGQQAAKVPRVAYIQGGYAELPPDLNANSADPNVAAFFKELARLGYVEGRTVTFDRYNGTPTYAQQSAQAAVQSAPDVIFSAGATTTALAVMPLTKSIPVVALSGDPLGSGLVTSLTRPGGNLTAVASTASSDSEAKVLSVLAQTMPTVRRVAYMCVGANGQINPPQAGYLKSATDAAPKLGLILIPVIVEEPGDAQALRDAFERAIAAKVDAIQFSNQAQFNNNAALMAGLTLAARVPSISPFTAIAAAGGLLSYGSNGPDNYRRAAGYVALVINGAKPADLPVLQPTLFDLVVNQKTAKAIGITIPQAVLVQATRVIEQG